MSGMPLPAAFGSYRSTSSYERGWMRNPNVRNAYLRSGAGRWKSVRSHLGRYGPGQLLAVTSSAFATFFERLEHHLRVLFHFLLQNRSDELGERGHTEIIINAEHDLRHPIAFRECPCTLELVEIAFDEAVIDPRFLIVEDIDFRPLDRRFFHERFPAGYGLIAFSLEHFDRFHVGHEVRVALHVFGEFVD